MKEVLSILVEGRSLSREQAYRAMGAIADGRCSEGVIASFLTVFRMRDPDAEEVLGFCDAMLERAVPIDLSDFDALDLVGTGGDGKNTFNISTLASFVVAGSGHPVTKHGNYGASSPCGSSNLLEALKIRFPRTENDARRQLEKSGITFLHAPLWHPSLKPLAALRRELGFRTVFNLLGPLVNPSGPRIRVLGACTRNVQRLYSNVLGAGEGDFCVLHTEGYDEVSLTGVSVLSSRRGEEHLRPQDFGVSGVQESDLAAQASLALAVEEALDILTARGPRAKTDTVLANAAVAIRAARRGSVSLLDAMSEARESLEAGSAFRCLKELQNLAEAENCHA